MSAVGHEERTPGAGGHPEPGSGHDEAETVTVEQGPARRPVGGVPGAFGNVETEGAAATETELEGKGARVAEETGG
jgi:hypothetical protein